MELELREIRERPFIFYLFLAIFIHIALICGVFYFFRTPMGLKLLDSQGTDVAKSNQPAQEQKTPVVIPGESPGNQSGETEPKPAEQIPEAVQETTAENTSGTTENIEIPPFENSELNSRRIQDNTFIHPNSGLLFADEITVGNGKTTASMKSEVVKPVINREFTLKTLPLEFRDREWNLTLRLKVDKTGKPSGRVKVIKSSGNSLLDQIISDRVNESTFQPAHYEGSITNIDYTYDLEIQIK